MVTQFGGIAAELVRMKFPIIHSEKFGCHPFKLIDGSFPSLIGIIAAELVGMKFPIIHSEKFGSHRFKHIDGKLYSEKFGSYL